MVARFFHFAHPITVGGALVELGAGQTIKNSTVGDDPLRTFGYRFQRDFILDLVRSWLYYRGVYTNLFRVSIVGLLLVRRLVCFTLGRQLAGVVSIGFFRGHGLVGGCNEQGQAAFVSVRDCQLVKLNEARDQPCFYFFDASLAHALTARQHTHTHIVAPPLCIASSLGPFLLHFLQSTIHPPLRDHLSGTATPNLFAGPASIFSFSP